MFWNGSFRNPSTTNLGPIKWLIVIITGGGKGGKSSSSGGRQRS